MAWWLSCVVVILILNGASTEKNKSERHRLFTDLLSDYGDIAAVGPRSHHEEAVNITIGFHLYEVVDINSRTKGITTLGELLMIWDDHYLSWDPDEYSGVHELILLSEKIWHPRVVISNSITNRYQEDWTTIYPLAVESSGLCSWSIQQSFETTCTLDITWFPFDSQQCDIVVNSGVASTNSIYLQTEEFWNNHGMDFMEEFAENGEWEVIDVKIISGFLESSSIGQTNFTKVCIRISLDRKHLYYTLLTTMPTIILYLASMLTFAVPCASGEKISISVTVLLSYIMFLMLILDSLPRTSEYVSVLWVYLSMMGWLIALSTACTVFNVELYHRDPSKPITKCLNNYVINKIGHIVHGNYQDDEVQPQEKDIGVEKFHVDDGIKEVLDEDDIPCQILYKIYTVLGTMNVPEEKKVSDVKEAAHWKRASRTMDLVFVIVFMSMFLLMHTALPLLFILAHN